MGRFLLATMTAAERALQFVNDSDRVGLGTGRAASAKGFGGALLRERVVATVSRRLIILAGPETLVPVLGTRGTLPVEVGLFLGLADLVLTEQDGQVQERRRPDMRGKP
jgi:ribose 5-phosphate isomerase